MRTARPDEEFHAGGEMEGYPNANEIWRKGSSWERGDGASGQRTGAVLRKDVDSVWNRHQSIMDAGW
jgi:hypothetical protein